MTRLSPLLTSKKVLTFTYPDIQETTITPETLPTTEPTNPQIAYTVAQADLVQTSFPLFKRVEVGCVNASGTVVTAATISYRMVKNGSSVKTGTFTVAANYYYRLGYYFYNVAVDDVLGIKLWSNQTDSNWDVKTLFVAITRITPIDKPRCLYLVESAALLNRVGSGTPTFYHKDFTYQTANAFTIPFWYPHDTYGIFRVSRGDSMSPDGAESSTGTTRPAQKGGGYTPTQIIFRGLRID